MKKKTIKHSKLGVPKFFAAHAHVSKKFPEKAKNKGEMPNVCVAMLRTIKDHCNENKIKSILKVSSQHVTFGDGGKYGTCLHVVSKSGFRCRIWCDERLTSLRINILQAIDHFKYKHEKECIVSKWDDINDPKFDPVKVTDKAISIIDAMIVFDEVTTDMSESVTLQRPNWYIRRKKKKCKTKPKAK